MSFYPNLSEATVLQLRVALQHMKDDPDYVEKSTYSDEIKDFLKEIGGRGVSRDPIVFDGEMSRLDYVEQEIVVVLNDLQDLVAGLKAADHSEKLQVAKARAGLVEKLVAAREKIWTMKESAEFQGRILSYLEDICSKDQIAELRDRLRDLKSVEDGQ